MATYTYRVKGKVSGKMVPVGRNVYGNDDVARSEVGKAVSDRADVFHPDALVEIVREDGTIISDLGTVEQVTKK